MVAQTKDARRVDTLVSLLDDIASAHEELLLAIDEKIAAMRSADSERIHRAAEREHGVVRRISDREGLRRQLTENLARGYGIGAAAARRLSADQLAARIGGPHQEAIHATTSRLRKLTADVSQRNHIAQLILQNILRHLKPVFAAMTAQATGSARYSSAGGLDTGDCQRIFDAVG